VAPAVLEADPRSDIDERQVVVERIVSNWGEDPPGGDGPSDQQEPCECCEAEIAEDPAVDPPDYEES
jgi:hypothetical protein